MLTRPSLLLRAEDGNALVVPLLLIALSIFYKQVLVAALRLDLDPPILGLTACWFGLKYPTRFHDTHIQRL